MASKQHADLIVLAETYATYAERSEATISNWCVGHARLFSRLRAGKSCTIDTFNAAIAWFGENWPSDLEWPRSVPRPPKAKEGGRVMQSGDTFAAAQEERAARQAELLEWERRSNERYGRSRRFPSGWWIVPVFVAGVSAWAGLIWLAVSALADAANDSPVGDILSIAAIIVILIVCLAIGGAFE